MNFTKAFSNLKADGFGLAGSFLLRVSSCLSSPSVSIHQPAPMKGGAVNYAVKRSDKIRPVVSKRPCRDSNSNLTRSKRAALSVELQGRHEKGAGSSSLRCDEEVGGLAPYLRSDRFEQSSNWPACYFQIYSFFLAFSTVFSKIIHAPVWSWRTPGAWIATPQREGDFYVQ